MNQRDDNFIYAAFSEEGLNIVDAKQIEELRRWFLLDFEKLDDYSNDQFVSEARIISICGSGRSGTTLTRVMLDSHPNIYSGPESLLFLPIDVDVENLSSKFEIVDSEISHIKNRSESRSEFIDKFATLVLNKNNKQIWADKTVRNIHCIPYINKHFPNAKIINVIRDPRDTIASLRTHKKRKLENGEIKNTGYVMPLTLCIDRWNLSVSDAVDFRNNENYLEVHYESLVLDTEKSLVNICNFCGVTYDATMMNYHEIKGATRDYKNFIQNIEATKPVSKDSIGRYRTIFTQEQINLIEKQTEKNAIIMGYKF